MGLLALIADVVFIGQSLVGPVMPGMVETALQLQGEPSHVEAQVIDGAGLAQAWDSAAGAQGVDARARLASRAADVVILTEMPPIAAADPDTSAAAIAQYGKLALAANPATRLMLYETWPPPGSTDAPWQDQLQADLPLWETLARKAAQDLGHPVTLIPAGQGMARLDDAISAGQLPGVAGLGDFLAADGTPTAKGWYYLAMLQTAAISGKTPVGLPARLGRSWASRDAVISQDLAARLQALAWTALQSYVPGPPSAVEGAGAAVPAPQVPPMPVFPAVSNPNLALNLSGIVDWGVNLPFLDLMKTARPWVGHKPGQWGGWGHDDLAKAGALGPDGWPTAIPAELTGISTLLLTDLPEDTAGAAGRYQLTYRGNGTLQISGRASVVDASPGRIDFDYTPGEGAVILTLTAIDAADPIRDIVVVRADRADRLAAGEIFNPDWLARIKGVKAIRLMDWMATNNSPLAHAADRPKPGDYTYARIGVPAEVMVALANTLHADPWFTLPHLADDDLVRTYAQIVHDGLDPTLVASVEYSNEVWNWQFTQAQWAEAQGKARWGQDKTWVQFYALRAAEVAGIWAEVFGDAPARLRRIIATQTGWPGLEAQILDAPLVLAEGRAAPGESFDAYAVTGYFSALIGSDQKAAAVKDWLVRSEAAARQEAATRGLAGDAEADYVAAHRYDLADQLAEAELRDGSVTGDASDSLGQLLSQTLPYQASVAADHGLALVMYEGGSHVVGLGAEVDDPALADFFMHFNYTPEMAGLYATMLSGWRMLTDQPFNAFSDVARPGKWGSWGALRHLGDDNPRWQVLARGCPQC